MEEIALLKIFKQGLIKSVKKQTECEPGGLCACLQMVLYCCRVSPGFLPEKRFDLIKIEKITRESFRLIIPLRFSGAQAISDAPRFLVISASTNSPENLEFGYLRELEPSNNAEVMPVSTISPINQPFEVLLKKALAFFRDTPE